MSQDRGKTERVDGAGKRFGIVASRFNQQIVDALLAGAVDCLQEHAVRLEDIEIVHVPGAWEIPQALSALASRGEFDALISIGAVIRGETSHYEVICTESARGIAEVARRWGMPVTFGVLTCDSVEQARARSGGDHGNKGRDAAQAALEMIQVLARAGGESRTKS